MVENRWAFRIDSAQIIDGLRNTTLAAGMALGVGTISGIVAGSLTGSWSVLTAVRDGVCVGTFFTRMLPMAKFQKYFKDAECGKSSAPLAAGLVSSGIAIAGTMVVSGLVEGVEGVTLRASAAAIPLLVLGGKTFISKLSKA